MHDEAVEDRLAAEQGLARDLARLSSVDQTPEGFMFRSGQAFAADDVDFDGSWFDLLLQEQDWLRLPSRLDPGWATEVQALELFRALSVAEPGRCFSVDATGSVLLSVEGLDVLAARASRAVEHMTAYADDLNDSTWRAATKRWEAHWDDVVEESVAGPIRATTGVWPIQDFVGRAVKGRLDISPSYQRGDAWLTPDAQLLVESILRGIPLPSVILLRPRAGRNAASEVVDGKQRLTSILRFVAGHPEALRYVEELDERYPGHDLKTLFRNDYRHFRQVWQRVTGELLSSQVEREHYFPFKIKLSRAVKAGDARLTPLDGRYYDEVLDHVLDASSSATVGDIFASASDYKIPVIEYIDATPQQVHQVFALYNKQGKHLNAEEVRNAAHHDVPLLRSLAVLAGDDSNVLGAPALASRPTAVEEVERVLTSYQVPAARYRRTKVLSWTASLLLSDCLTKQGTPAVKSTAQQIELMLQQARSRQSRLSSPEVVGDAVLLLADALSLHESMRWPSAFAGEKGWQDLPLVASLLGVCFVVGTDPTGAEMRLQDAAAALVERASGGLWKRDSNTQTRTQWAYVARVSLDIASEAGLTLGDVHERLVERYDASPVEALEQLQ